MAAIVAIPSGWTREEAGVYRSRRDPNYVILRLCNCGDRYCDEWGVFYGFDAFPLERWHTLAEAKDDATTYMEDDDQWLSPAERLAKAQALAGEMHPVRTV